MQLLSLELPPGRTSWSLRAVAREGPTPSANELGNTLQYFGELNGMMGSVAGRSDATRILEETLLCEIADLKRSRRQVWARDQLLRKAPRGGKYGELDAIEAAVLARLVRVLGYEDAVVAWRSVRDAVAAPSHERLELLFDLTTKAAVLTSADSEIAAFARQGHPVRLVVLDEVIGDVRSAFARIKEAKRARERARTATSARRTA